MKRRLGFILALVLVFALAVALVGCNGDNGNEANGDDTTTFVIGFGGPLTQGAVGFGQGALRATELAVDRANASAEAQELGIQFRIAEGDDQSDPLRANTVANALISERDLVGIVGHFNSGVTDPAGEIYHEHGVVQISYGSTRVDLTHMGRENFFRTCGTDDLQGPALADAAYALGFRSAAIINDSSPYGVGLREEFVNHWNTLDGTSVVLDEETQQAQSEFGPVVTRVRSLDPDVVFFAGTYDATSGAGALFARQMADGGVEAPVLGGDGIQKDGFIEEAGPGAEGTIATLPGLPFDLMPGGESFVAGYTEMFPGETPGGFDGAAYDATNVIIQAVFAVARENGVDNVATTAGRRAIIEYVTDITIEGLSGPLSFTENGDINNPVVTTYEVVDGEWVVHPDIEIWTR